MCLAFYAGHIDLLRLRYQGISAFEGSKYKNQVNTEYLFPMTWLKRVTAKILIRLTEPRTENFPDFFLIWKNCWFLLTVATLKL